MAAFSRHDTALAWAKDTAESAWGPIALTSPDFDFVETGFYEKSMGNGLRKRFLAFEQLVDPGQLPDWKITSNDWEIQCHQQADWREARPLNLDPGYLTEAKLVLASTKDRDHRIYLDRGIYAEGTLFFHHGAWCTRPWTYPDYQRAEYHEFFLRCREYLRQRFRQSRATDQC